MKRPPLPLVAIALCALASSCKKEARDPSQPSAKPESGSGSNGVSAFVPTAGAGTGSWIEGFQAVGDAQERLELISDKIATGADDLEEIVSVALDDRSVEIRREAMLAFSNVTGPRSVPLLTKASADADEFVRDYALTQIRGLPINLMMEAHAANITSPHEDVRTGTIRNLANMQNHEGFALMLEAIKDGDPNALEQVNVQAKALVGKSFTNYTEATAWREANRARLDENLQPGDGQ